VPGLVVFLGCIFGLSGVRTEPLVEPGSQNVRVGLVIASGEDEAGVGECSRSPRSRLPLRTARVTGLKRCGATRPLPPRPTEVPTGSRTSGLLEYWPERGFGVARAPSPDVRYGHPCPSLSPRRYRFRPPGCAHRRGRLTEHGRPLAVERLGERGPVTSWIGPVIPSRDRVLP
jgi:hypothetical protein